MSFASKPRAQKHMKKLSPLVIPEPMISLSFTNGFADKLRSSVVTNSPSSFADKLREAVTMARHETQRMDDPAHGQTELHKFVDE